MNGFNDVNKQNARNLRNNKKNVTIKKSSSYISIIFVCREKQTINARQYTKKRTVHTQVKSIDSQKLLCSEQFQFFFFILNLWIQNVGLFV